MKIFNQNSPADLKIKCLLYCWFLVYYRLFDIDGDDKITRTDLEEFLEEMIDEDEIKENDILLNAENSSKNGDKKTSVKDIELANSVHLEVGSHPNNKDNKDNKDSKDNKEVNSHNNTFEKIDKIEKKDDEDDINIENEKDVEEEIDEGVPEEINKEAIFDTIFKELNFNENKKYIDYEEFSKVLWSSNIDSLCVINLDINES